MYMTYSMTMSMNLMNDSNILTFQSGSEQEEEQEGTGGEELGQWWGHRSE